MNTVTLRRVVLAVMLVFSAIFFFNAGVPASTPMQGSDAPGSGSAHGTTEPGAYDEVAMDITGGLFNSGVMAMHVANAQNSGKKLMLVFGAEWCDRCVLLERFIRQSTLQPAIDDGYELIWVEADSWVDFDRADQPQREHIRSMLPAVMIVDATSELAQLTRGEDLLTFIPDRDELLYPWLEKVLQYAALPVASR